MVISWPKVGYDSVIAALWASSVNSETASVRNVTCRPSSRAWRPALSTQVWEVRPASTTFSIPCSRSFGTMSVLMKLSKVRWRLMMTSPSCGANAS